MVDIVERLRAEGCRNGGQGAYAWRARELCSEAADEINRLREALAYVLRAYEYEAQGVEDTLLMVPEGSRVFSIATARAALKGDE